MSAVSKPIFTVAAIEKNLPTSRVGRTCIVYDRTESTNAVLHSVITDLRYDGLAVFANFQAKGRGRNARTWQAEAGSSVLCSVLIHLSGRQSRLAGPINLAAAVATVQAINRAFPVGARIKWPNDVFVGEKKLGGILIEGSQVNESTAGFVIGIGLNVTQAVGDFPSELVGSATSIAFALDRQVDQHDRVTLARGLLIALDETVATVVSGDMETLRTAYLSLTTRHDRAVTVEHEGRRFHGRIIDIDWHDNSLLVQDEAGLIWHLKQNISRVIQ